MQKLSNQVITALKFDAVYQEYRHRNLVFSDMVQECVLEAGFICGHFSIACFLLRL